MFSNKRPPHPSRTSAQCRQTMGCDARKSLSSHAKVVCAARTGRRRADDDRPSSRRSESRSAAACASARATSIDRVRTKSPRRSSGAVSAARRRMRAEACSPLASSTIHGLSACAIGSNRPSSVRLAAIARASVRTEFRSASGCLRDSRQKSGDPRARYKKQAMIRRLSPGYDGETDLTELAAEAAAIFGEEDARDQAGRLAVPFEAAGQEISA